jgi:hypothetical protein
LGDESGGPIYKTADGGQTWQLAAPEKSPQPALSLLEGSSLAVWPSDKFGWAITSGGSCTGEKSSPDFTCWSASGVQLTTDGGLTWQVIPLPSPGTSVP